MSVSAETQDRVNDLLLRAQAAHDRMRGKNPHKALIRELATTVIAFAKAFDQVAEEHAKLAKQADDRRIIIPN